MAERGREGWRERRLRKGKESKMHVLLLEFVLDGRVLDSHKFGKRKIFPSFLLEEGF